MRNREMRREAKRAASAKLFDFDSPQNRSTFTSVSMISPRSNVRAMIIGMIIMIRRRPGHGDVV